MQRNATQRNATHLKPVGESMVQELSRLSALVQCASQATLWGVCGSAALSAAGGEAATGDGGVKSVSCVWPGGAAAADDGAAGDSGCGCGCEAADGEAGACEGEGAASALAVAAAAGSKLWQRWWEASARIGRDPNPAPAPAPASAAAAALRSADGAATDNTRPGAEDLRWARSAGGNGELPDVSCAKISITHKPRKQQRCGGERHANEARRV